MRRLSFVKAKELDKKFDEGKSILKHLDLSKARRLMRCTFATHLGSG